MSQSETGHSGSDSKLKSLDRNIAYLEKSLEEYSNNILTTTDENGNLIHNGFESSLKKTETDIAGVKKFAPNYDLSSRVNSINSLEKEYNDIKSNSKQRIEGIQAEKQKKEFETSSEFFLERESFKLKEVDPKMSDFHKANGSTIVFSKSMISKENPNQLSSSFNATDRIYARVFLENGFLNETMFGSNGDSSRYMPMDAITPYAKISIDGIERDYLFESTILFGDDAKATTRQLWFHPLTSDGLTDIKWVKEIGKLSVGAHDVKVSYYIEQKVDKIINGSPVQNTHIAKLAEGSFTINKQEGDAIKIGKKWSDFKPEKSDPKLESDILGVALKITKYEDGMMPKAVKIMDSDWTIVKHEITGAILYRYITVQIKHINPDGYCTTKPRQAKQEYLGGGYATKITLITQYNKNIGFDGYIDCE